MSSEPETPASPAVVPVDAAMDMVPLPQPTGPTYSQELLEDYPDFKMYKERAIVEL